MVWFQADTLSDGDCNGAETEKGWSICHMLFIQTQNKKKSNQWMDIWNAASAIYKLRDCLETSSLFQN